MEATNGLHRQACELGACRFRLCPYRGCHARVGLTRS